MVMRTIAKPLAWGKGGSDAANPWWKVWASYQDSGGIEKGEILSRDSEEEGETQEKEQGPQSFPGNLHKPRPSLILAPPWASPPCSSHPVFIFEASFPHQLLKSFLSTYYAPGNVLGSKDTQGCDRSMAVAFCVGKCQGITHVI